MAAMHPVTGSRACDTDIVCGKWKLCIYQCTMGACYFLDAEFHMGRVKRIWYLSPMRAAKVQASLRIRAVSPEPPLLAHTSSESRGTFRQKARSLAPLNGWACAVKICHDGMLEDTNSLDGAHIILMSYIQVVILMVTYLGRRRKQVSHVMRL